MISFKIIAYYVMDFHSTFRRLTVVRAGGADGAPCKTLFVLVYFRASLNKNENCPSDVFTARVQNKTTDVIVLRHERPFERPRFRSRTILIKHRPTPDTTDEFRPNEHFQHVELWGRCVPTNLPTS